MDKSRNISFDLLRIIAAFSVVVLHVCSKYIDLCPVGTMDFNAANFYNSINRFGVPIFVMISGAIFLNPQKQVDTKRLWLHNIFRIFIVYLVWGFLYYLYQCIHDWNFNLWTAGIVRTVKGIVYGSDHLWFLPMIIGLYMLVPILRSWLGKATKQNVEYFLVLFFVFQIAKTTVEILLGSSLVTRITELFKIVELTGYLGYFVLGYYLTNYEVSKKIRYAVYLSVPADIALNYLVSWKFSNIIGYYHPGVYDCFGIFTFAEVIAIFMVIINVVSEKKIPTGLSKFIKNVSSDTFGIYLGHVMILNFAYSEGWFSKALPSALYVLPVSLAVFTAMCLVSAGLRRLPFVGRYLA